MKTSEGRTSSVKVVITGPTDRFRTKPPEHPVGRVLTTGAYFGESDEDVEEIDVAINGIAWKLPALEEIELEESTVELLENAGLELEYIAIDEEGEEQA
jgi:hypothetical protein